ncbi:MAG TPA: hypothetical protein VNP04_12770 [Alphaproteobacteria bacterium]|nr:hypothetical protein [Alphaproteobacteria bacterium]
MSQRMAVVLSAALTVFVVIVAVALGARLGRSAPEATSTVDPLPTAQRELGTVTSANVTEIVAQREQGYRQLVEEANGRLQQAYDNVRALQAQLLRLQSQNAALVEREQTYQQRLQEANRLLQQLAPSAPAGSRGPTSEWQEANGAESGGRVAYSKAKKGKHERDDDRAYGRGEHDEDDDD